MVELTLPTEADFTPPAGYKQTKVGVIPKEWTVASLGDIVEIETGSTPPTQVLANYGDEYLFVSPVDIDEGKYITDTEKKLSKKGFSISRRFPAGSILFVSIGSTIGKCGIAAIELTSNQQINAILPSPRFSLHYLYYVICATAPRIRALAGEQAVPIVNKTQLSGTILPLAPIDEQLAIAETLSEADKLMATLDALIAKKRAIKQAAMQQLLTGRTRLPGFTGEWETTSLERIGTFLKGRGIKREDVSSEGYPCIRYGELYTRYENYVFNLVARTSQDVASRSIPIRTGDLLFAGSGETADEIGRCTAYLGKAIAFAGGDIIILRPNRGNSMYLGCLMNLPGVTIQKTRMAQGDAVVHISGRNLCQIQIDLPPVPEQDAIATTLADMDIEIALIEHRRQKTLTIKQGMMQQLLTGRKRLVDGGRTETVSLTC